MNNEAPSPKTALIIGAGPAGLMAADVLSARGHKVVVAESKPSVARKLLMAGKSGLNLTKDEPLDQFLDSYGEARSVLQPIVSAFGPPEVQAWAESLDQEVFTGSTGRVFPKAMKASPLLRNWLGKLAQQGVEVKTRHRWVGMKDGYVFETPDGRLTMKADAVVLACGGSSWARLGSDGAWMDFVDLPIAPIKPTNMGFDVAWSTHMEKYFGTPVKGVRLMAGPQESRGEFVISKTGIEGGGVYELSRFIRDGETLQIDLLPDMTIENIRKRMEIPRGKASLSNHLRKTLKLDPVKQALLMEFGRPLPSDLAPMLKALPISLRGPRSLDQAISTAGGLPFDVLDENLMVRTQPGVFAAGEMLDWEAPTGGYLLTACLATGRWAGLRAAEWLSA
ncbi:TIGR03862 family flavoprotein [Cognatishimia maritima]|uniref:TIGR03862 family flavoprotein n=1 Tax=Cognatishimia maritima TaxID=870908 RepID=A0A1M5T0P5_9RHOB|nr:TIGR03862 family flavoprotein [Cognatishimia maritima]SHH44286.1 hypothetical protein SAMN04488044_2549 [Cognatishimia maritima]